MKKENTNENKIAKFGSVIGILTSIFAFLNISVFEHKSLESLLNKLLQTDDSEEVTTYDLSPTVSPMCTPTSMIDIKNKVEKIQEKYYSLPNPNDLPEPTLDRPIRRCYDSDSMIIIKVYCGYNDVNYSRMYYYDNEQLYFALIYFKSKEEHRLYFDDNYLIRYRDENGIIHDSDKESIICELAEFALKDSNEVLNDTN